MSDVGWYRDLPDEVAGKISIADEIEDIHRALERLNQTPAAYAAMGSAAQARLGLFHAPASYAQALGEALAEFPKLAQRFASRRLLERVADRTWNCQERRLVLERSCSTISGMFE